MFFSKKGVKAILGERPLTAEIFWQLRHSGEPTRKKFSLHRLEKSLPEWTAHAAQARQHTTRSSHENRRILLFSTLRYWLEHSTLLATALVGLGHEVTLAFLPYVDWKKTPYRFDVRRYNLYTKKVLGKAEPMVQIVSFFDTNMALHQTTAILPSSLEGAVKQIAIYDVQYTLQVEDIELSDKESISAQLFNLRHERNAQAALSAFNWMRTNPPQLLLIPNGSILEMGAIYQTARYLEIPVVTYEFGEQRQRIWLARNTEVMHQETDELWCLRKNQPLHPAQWSQIRTLFTSRQQASLWENFSRRWQGLPSQGGARVRKALNLDTRPVVLLAANVIGDSLTLGRQVFSQSMTEWLDKTVRYFANRPDIQLVIRVHPGERYIKGPSIANVVKNAITLLPENIHLVAADAQINTYDLVDIARLGLVYTTTVGLELAMSGVPVAVVGNTHYRDKGFTLDPASWDDYYQLLDQALANQNNIALSSEQVELAWNYAYRFFFEYPLPFPWHLHFWEEIKTWPMDRVLSEEGQAAFGDTFRYLVGEPRDWSKEYQA